MILQRQKEWRNVKIPGKTPARARTSNFTFRLEAKNYPSANNAGTKLQSKNTSGEKTMENFSANSARSLIGKNVNLHLKDGAVIINVQLNGILKDAGKNSLIKYTPYGNRRTTRIPLRSVAWAELLNLHLLKNSKLKCY
jgi:hypothetical protein